MKSLVPKLLALPLLLLVTAANAPAPAKNQTANNGVAKNPGSENRAATRPPVAEVVAQLQKNYDSMGALRAKFSQVLSGPMGRRQAQGIVSLKKPGKMRWDYEKPEKKLFVADGVTLWVYEPEDEQAYKQPLNSSQLPAQVSFLFGRGRLHDEFEVTYHDEPGLGQAGEVVLRLLPKVASAQYRHLLFVVDPKTFLVKETVLFDQQGGKNHLAFSSVEANPKTGVDDSRFSFSPPPDTKIITPR